MRYLIRALLFAIVLVCIKFNINAQSVGGTTSGSAIYCANDNAGFINLDVGSYNGTILHWQSSVDSVNWVNTNTSGFPSQSYDSLTQSTCFRVIVQDGSFPPAISTVSCVEIYPASVGGTITGGGVSCISPGTGNGTLVLTGSTGAILYWQDSIAGNTAWDSIPVTNNTLSHTNLTQTTFYRAIVQSGSTCPKDTSTIASFSFDSLSVSGNLSGSDTVCYQLNSGVLNLAGKVGNVTGWLTSTDGSSWSPVSNTDTSQTYNGLLQTTWYEAIVKNASCPADTSNFAAITIVPNPIDAGLDTTIELGQSVTLHGTGAGTALWTPATGLDSTTVFHPTATPTSTTTTYTLTVTDNHSCITVDSVTITTYTLTFNGMVSNLMTPNGDGINDSWYIQSILDYPNNEVFIYNIYGNLVYNKKSYTNDWKGTYNGKDLPDGTYYFVLKFSDSDKVIKGSLDILKNK